MCWKKIEQKEDPVNIVQVTLSGSNPAAAEYAGIYIKNRHNDEYFKLGENSFHTLCPIISQNQKREGWAFKKHLENNAYASMSQTDYAVYANPFTTGYGNSTLTISKDITTTQRALEAFNRQAEIKNKQTKIIQDQVNELFKELNNPQTKEKQKEKELTNSITHETFGFSEKIDSPIVKDTLNKNGLYKENEKKVNIEWEKVDCTGYRLEIFKEENGEYNSYIYDLNKNSFSFEPEGGNYFFRVKAFKKEGDNYIHGGYSNNFKFTKLYPGNCLEQNITIHLHNYEDKNLYLKINGKWYGTGAKYGEPKSIINLPCPAIIEEYDYENDPKYIITRFTTDSSKIINSIDLQKEDKKEINKNYTNKKINQSISVSCTHRSP
jgi:hypothetical protein